MNKKSYCLGGEQSGHIILSEYSNTGDGILGCFKDFGNIKAIQILKNIQLFDNYNSYYHQEKINLLIKNKLNNKTEKFNKKNIQKKFNLKKSNTFRCLVRESGTEPLIRILG